MVFVMANRPTAYPAVLAEALKLKTLPDPIVRATSNQGKKRVRWRERIEVIMG